MRYFGIGAAGLFAGAMALGFSAPAAAQGAAEQFYKGKTINIYIGFSPGGSYDYYARLYARYMPRYIPGNPNMVPQTMTGAASLGAANHLYSVAPKDGTALGVVTQTVMVEEAMQTPGVKYKAAEFSWIGRMTAVVETMIVAKQAKARSIADVRKYETIVGGTGPTSPTEGYPRLLNAFAGTKFKIISGYPGSTDVMLAMEKGEVDSTEVSWNTLARNKQAELARGDLFVVVQAALERSRDLPEIPTLVEFGETPDAKAALAFYSSTGSVGRALLGTPGIPADRLKVLRDAFKATWEDKDFLAEIKKSEAEFDPASGEYLQDLAAKIAATPKDIVERTAAALRPH